MFFVQVSSLILITFVFSIAFALPTNINADPWYTLQKKKSGGTYSAPIECTQDIGKVLFNEIIRDSKTEDKIRVEKKLITKTKCQTPTDLMGRYMAICYPDTESIVYYEFFNSKRECVEGLLRIKDEQ